MTAKPEAANGKPWPTCPYALPANEAATPSNASVVAKPNAKARESPTI